MGVIMYQARRLGVIMYQARRLGVINQARRLGVIMYVIRVAILPLFLAFFDWIFKMF